jgi:phage/plasmid-associated DNA primase
MENKQNVGLWPPANSRRSSVVLKHLVPLVDLSLVIQNFDRLDWDDAKITTMGERHGKQGFVRGDLLRSLKAMYLQAIGDKVEHTPHYGMLTVSYSQIKKPFGFRGRMYAHVNAPEMIVSVQAMVRCLRHTLYAHVYDDLDIVNAHVVLLSQYLVSRDYQGSMEVLARLLCERDKVLSEIQEGNDGCDREMAKTAVLSVVNGGEGYAIQSKPEWWTLFQTEMRGIQEYVAKLHPEIYENCVETNPDNPLGSCISLVLCELEDYVLCAIQDSLMGMGYSCDVLTFDGLQVRRKPDPLDLSVLRKTEANVKIKTGFQITLVVKPMDAGFSIPPASDGSLSRHRLVDLYGTELCVDPRVMEIEGEQCVAFRDPKDTILILKRGVLVNLFGEMSEAIDPKHRPSLRKPLVLTDKYIPETVKTLALTESSLTESKWTAMEGKTHYEIIETPSTMQAGKMGSLKTIQKKAVGEIRICMEKAFNTAWINSGIIVNGNVSIDQHFYEDPDAGCRKHGQIVAILMEEFPDDFCRFRTDEHSNAWICNASNLWKSATQKDVINWLLVHTKNSKKLSQEEVIRMYDVCFQELVAKALTREAALTLQGFGDVVDDNPNLLVLDNCLIDTSSGKPIMRDILPTDHVSATTQWSYDPTKAEKHKGDVQTYFEKLFPLVEERRTALIVLAQILTGQRNNKWGLIATDIRKGWNGKSKLAKFLKYFLGSFAVETQKGKFICDPESKATDINSHESGMFQFKNRHLAIYEELSSSMSLNVSNWKTSTGGCELVLECRNANLAKRERIRWKAIHLLVFNEGCQPKFPETDAALQQRMIFLPFRSRFVAKDHPDLNAEHTFVMDDNIDSKLLEWRHALLNILMEKYDGSFQPDEYRMPDSMKTWKRERVSENDQIGDLLDFVTPCSCPKNTPPKDCKHWVKLNDFYKLSQVKKVLSRKSDRTFFETKLQTWVDERATTSNVSYEQKEVKVPLGHTNLSLRNCIYGAELSLPSTFF